MKSNLAHRYMVYPFILIMAVTGIVRGQSPQSANLTVDSQENSLQLPSFSIFGLPTPAETTNIEKPIHSKEFEKFIASVERAKASKGIRKAPDYYWIIPIIFYRARNLFAKALWTKEEIKQGQEISAFLARLFAKPDLKIEKPDPESFRNGLKTLRNWFVSLCQDNRTLGLMIYTTDDGPFFGEHVDAGRISELRLQESVQIPDQQASFVLMTDRGHPEPVIIGVVNADGSVRWLKRYSGAPKGRITSATFVKRTIFLLEGYGYVCGLMADWSYGFEQSAIYLDDSLNLRFYFISW
jgi:hypothetical protein